jgi:hypothetical protein
METEKIDDKQQTNQNKINQDPEVSPQQTYEQCASPASCRLRNPCAFEPT